MSRARPGRIAAGLLLGSVGASVLWMGLWPPAFLGAAAAGYPARNFIVGGGVGMAGGGLLVLLLSFGRREAAPQIVPAEVAFVQPAVPRATAIPDFPAPRPAAAVAAAPSSRAAPAMRAAPLAPAELPSPEQIALKRISAEINELTRAINKAGVMLATGQLSSQGYAQYVEELKQQRAVLEKDRVHLEMRKHKLQP